MSCCLRRGVVETPLASLQRAIDLEEMIDRGRSCAVSGTVVPAPPAAIGMISSGSNKGTLQDAGCLGFSTALDAYPPIPG